MIKSNAYYNEKLQRLWLNVFSANIKSGDMGAYSIWELLYIFSREGGADLHVSSQGGC